MNIDNFIKVYTKNMAYISTPKARKINAIACMALLGSLPVEVSLKYFESFIKEIVPEVYYYINQKKKNGEEQKIPNPKTASRRKKSLRAKQNYTELDLHLLLKNTIREYQGLVSKSGMEIPVFEKKDLETRLRTILDA